MKQTGWHGGVVARYPRHGMSRFAQVSSYRGDQVSGV